MKATIIIVFLVLISCHRIERPLTLYAFLSTECPLSIEQTRTLNLLHERFDSRVTFKAVFPNIGDQDTVIEAFIDRYQITMDVIHDQQHRLKDLLDASVTPQFFLVDDNGRVLYSGQCDNRMISLGKKRKVVTEHYLEKAIEEALTSNSMSSSSTEPIGCSIFDREALCNGR